MEPKNEIILYQPDSSIQLEVRIENETVWLTQNQMVKLFQRDVSVISRHIHNIFKEGELDKESNLHFLQIAFSDKPVIFYSLDVIISVGYRVKSKRGTQFRIWARRILKDYLLKGYVVNQRIERLEHKIIEHDQKFDLLIKTALPPNEGVFFEKQFFDAYIFASDLIKSAKKSIVLIDNYFIDDVVYHIGASLKDLGKRMFAFSKMKISHTLILENI